MQTYLLFPAWDCSMESVLVYSFSCYPSLRMVGPTNRLISLCHVLNESGIFALVFWNSPPYVSGLLNYASLPLWSLRINQPWPDWWKQLLQIIISICSNLLERHTGRTGQLMWCHASPSPKRILTWLSHGTLCIVLHVKTHLARHTS